MTLPLHTNGQLTGAMRHTVMKVLSLSEALDGQFPLERVLVDLRNDQRQVNPDALRSVGVAGLLTAAAIEYGERLPVLHSLKRDEVVAPGDVIRVRERGHVSVLYRRTANANFLFTTERCNSLCLMCSQPPRDVDDSWRVGEILDTVRLIDPTIGSLGVTGGEPTLLGGDLAVIIRAVQSHLPATQLNILSNGRLLADSALASKLAVDGANVLWAVPLYADTAPAHDFVVQAHGAFRETLDGLYNLAERHQSIEVRFVLHAQTIPRVLAFSDFVWRNLPFVSHVAFMGLEPMGFAKLNRDLLYVDPLDYLPEVERAAWYLHDRGIRVSIYNTPLCLLSRSAWSLARQSISDWKTQFVPGCQPCAMRDRCSGFFRSAGVEWRSRGIHPIMKEDFQCETC